MPLDERLLPRRLGGARPGAGRPTKSPVDGDRKWCPRCEQWKLLEEFRRDPTIKCGRTGRCIPCQNREKTPNPRPPLPVDHPRQRATKCKLHYIRRSPLGAAGVFEVFDPVEIFERDNWVCHLCGEAVEQDAAHNAPGYPTINHVIPLSHGGIHARGNVRLAHRQCNALEPTPRLPR